MVCDAGGWCGQRSFLYDEGGVYCVPPVGSERSSQKLSQQAAHMNTHVPSWFRGGRSRATSQIRASQGGQPSAKDRVLPGFEVDFPGSVLAPLPAFSQQLRTWMTWSSQKPGQPVPRWLSLRRGSHPPASLRLSFQGSSSAQERDSGNSQGFLRVKIQQSSIVHPLLWSTETFQACAGLDMLEATHFQSLNSHPSPSLKCV